MELSKHFDLTLLILQHKIEFVNGKEIFEWNNGIRIISAPLLKTGFVNKYVNAVKGRYFQKNWKQAAGSFTLRCYPAMKKLLKEEKFDVILFEHLGYESLLPLVKKYLPDTLKIVDMHNVDHLLFAQENDLELLANKKVFNKIQKAESSLYRVADIFFACSDRDKNILEHLNQNKIKGFAIPNGTDTNRCSFDIYKTLENKTILFCGSLDYQPNIEGLNWFYNESWPLIIQQIREAKLTVIGRNPSRNNFQNLMEDDRVDFIGEVEEVASFYKCNNICIAPILTGSGTRLKILEAMSYGNAMVSTTIGVEGIDAKNGENIILADTPEEFANAVIKLFRQPVLINRLRNNAHSFVCEKYSWNRIGHLTTKIIREELSTRVISSGSRK
jgi:glycosyltransferase involved in cell wall biosynthesis